MYQQSILTTRNLGTENRIVLNGRRHRRNKSPGAEMGNDPFLSRYHACLSRYHAWTDLSSGQSEPQPRREAACRRGPAHPAPAQ